MAIEVTVKEGATTKKLILEDAAVTAITEHLSVGKQTISAADYVMNSVEKAVERAANIAFVALNREIPTTTKAQTLKAQLLEEEGKSRPVKRTTA